MTYIKLAQLQNATAIFMILKSHEKIHGKIYDDDNNKTFKLNLHERLLRILP